MGREIRFRAWDKRNKKWRLPSEWYLHPLGLTCIYWNKDVFNSDDLVLAQFTGLRDKNGKEIYEGDILKFKDDYHESDKTVISYHDNGFWCGDGLDRFVPAMAYCEVIGNINENPELLKGGL